MNEEKAKEIIDKIFLSIFEKSNPYNLDEFYSRFAFDLKLPEKVTDAITNETTWTSSLNPSRFISQKNSEKIDLEKGWMLEKKDVSSLEEILKIWQSFNYITTERIFDSINVIKSDTVYKSENVYHSTNIFTCKNIAFSDSCSNSEFTLASQRSNNVNFCIRTDDSAECSNCYNVICSSKIINSFFIEDSYDLYECIFCSHLANKKYCIANMQFEENEYFAIKKEIINWIITS